MWVETGTFSGPVPPEGFSETTTDRIDLQIAVQEWLASIEVWGLTSRVVRGPYCHVQMSARQGVRPRLPTRGVLAEIVRTLRGLKRPSQRANIRRLQERGEALSTLRIRNAAVEDVPALVRLHVVTFNATHGVGPGHDLRERQWRADFETDRNGWLCFVVQAANGTLVGFATGHLLDPTGNLGFESRLNKIYLLSEYQRLGLGRRLVGHVARRFLQQGVSSMLLFSEAENPSCRFFDALGGERLLSEAGEFHGGYGWRTLEQLVHDCPLDEPTGN